MKENTQMVGQLSRSASRREGRTATSTAVGAASRRSTTPDQTRTSQSPALRLLHILALLTMPLSLYLVYFHGGEQVGYRGLLAAAIIVNLLILARIDVAYQREIREQLNQIASTSQPDNHE